MRTFALIFLFFTSAQAMMDPETLNFNNALAKFDAAYFKFRNIYCTIPIEARGQVPCVMGDIFPYGDWKTARETAMKLFRLQEK